jgi:hypothetical protein
MLLDDTWNWRGISLGWTELITVGGFGPRTGHRVAYDSVKKVIVMFGGCVPTCSFNFGEGADTTDDTVNDTWGLDGGAWDQKTPGTPPSNRCCGGMAFVDASFNHAVYFQGQDELNPDGLPGVWYWKWQGTNGQWIGCTGTNEACT